jgi:hypothetical protein
VTSHRLAEVRSTSNLIMDMTYNSAGVLARAVGMSDRLGDTATTPGDTTA